jgi:hypothetical protein
MLTQFTFFYITFLVVFPDEGKTKSFYSLVVYVLYSLKHINTGNT